MLLGLLAPPALRGQMGLLERLGRPGLLVLRGLQVRPVLLALRAPQGQPVRQGRLGLLGRLVRLGLRPP